MGKITIIQADITKLDVDVIVNATNSSLLVVAVLMVESTELLALNC